ncbi:MAG: hypothetical protein U0V03_11510 [Bacteroidia bacterium]
MVTKSYPKKETYKGEHQKYETETNSNNNLVEDKIIDNKNSTSTLQKSTLKKTTLSKELLLTSVKKIIPYPYKFKEITLKKASKKHNGLDFFDGIIGFLYLVMFVIFSAMYFIIIIAAYPKIPLLFALLLAMLLSLLSCASGQFISI